MTVLTKELQSKMTTGVIMMLPMVMISASLASIETSSSYKPDTRKCCLLSEVLVEEGPGQRRCTEVTKIGGAGAINPKSWRGHELKVRARLDDHILNFPENLLKTV